MAIKNIISVFFVLTLFFSCNKKEANTTTGQRTYRMGFQNSAPRLDFNIYLQSLYMWTPQADAAIVSMEVPWDSLLNGVTPQQYIQNNILGLVNYYHTNHLKLWVYIDPENGLDRSSDALSLIANNKSITQVPVQQAYRNFVIAMDTMLKPDHLGLALETNLIKGIAPDSIYEGVKQCANAAAQDIRTVDPTVKLSVSVQAEYAWGRLGGNGTYIGIAQDYIDFPFIQELGISSYPYFAFDDPEDIPANYYSILIDGKSIPVFVTEGGWTSNNITFGTQTIISDLQKQQRYITKQSQLLDNAHAIGLLSLTFTDIDVSSLPTSTPSSIQYFSYLGLVDINLQPKPALAVWDSIYKKTLQ